MRYHVTYHHDGLVCEQEQKLCPKCGMPLANNGKCPFCDKKK